VEVSVIPLGVGTHLGGAIAEVVRLVDASGLAYQLTPSGTCIEGEWDDLMALLKRCHDRVRKGSSRVIWTIKIDDEEGSRDMLTRHVVSVEERVGRATEGPKP